MKLTPDKYRAITEAERARCAAVVRAGIDNGNLGLARALAFESDLGADEAAQIVRGESGFTRLLATPANPAEQAAAIIKSGEKSRAEIH